MDNSAFPIKIVYVDVDEIKIARSPEEIDVGRSFIIIQTQCPFIQWGYFLAGMAAAIAVSTAYLYFVWG